MKETIIYRDQYKDVYYEINRFKAFGHTNADFNWAHYIHLNLDKLIPSKEIADKFWLTPQYDDKSRCRYEYYNSIINELEFHGGCTWYSKTSSADDKDRCIKIGCDYQHLWDDGRNYGIEYIKDQAQITIDSFLKLTPINKHCTGCGSYTLPETFVEGYCNGCTWHNRKDK